MKLRACYDSPRLEQSPSRRCRPCPCWTPWSGPPWTSASSDRRSAPGSGQPVADVINVTCMSLPYMARLGVFFLSHSQPEVSCLRRWGWVLSIKPNRTDLLRSIITQFSKLWPLLKKPLPLWLGREMNSQPLSVESSTLSTKPRRIVMDMEGKSSR